MVSRGAVVLGGASAIGCVLLGMWIASLRDGERKDPMGAPIVASSSAPGARASDEFPPDLAVADAPDRAQSALEDASDTAASGTVPAPPPALPGGLTEEYLRHLLTRKDLFHDAASEAKDLDAFQYAQRAVAILLRTQEGRADYGTPEERERGFSTKPQHDGQHVIVSGDARYRFERGEFPTYDRIHDRVEAMLARRRESGEAASDEPFPDDLVSALDQLGAEAARVFDRAR
jgi:hypothetical protein